MPMYEITEAQLEREVREKLLVEINKLTKEVTQQAQINLIKAQHELTGYMKTIVLTTFNQVFLETYGYNFNSESLNNSIECVIRIVGGELHPDIICNKNLFQMDYSIQRDTRDFNDNVTKENFDRLLDMVELDIMEEDGELTEYESPYDIAIDEIGVNHLDNDKIFSPINKSQRQGGFKSIDATYNKAKIQALQNFLAEYNRYLKPKLAKEYNIKL